MEVRQTPQYADWFRKLKDKSAAIRIETRVRRFQLGLFGDVKSVGEGVSEARIHYGPGYRVYFAQSGNAVVVLLCGGEKSSQTRDIAKAKQLKREL